VFLDGRLNVLKKELLMNFQLTSLMGISIALVVWFPSLAASQSTPNSPVTSSPEVLLQAQASLQVQVLPRARVLLQAQISPRSLPNGTVLAPPDPQGYGTLKVDNGTDRDAVVKVIDPQTSQLVGSFYASASQQSELQNIPDGTYEIIFTLGTDWDKAASTFTQNISYSRFGSTPEYTTRERVEGNTVYTDTSVYEITLHPVPSGKVPITTIDLSEFAKYK
jgi:hypothetical protein